MDDVSQRNAALVEQAAAAAKSMEEQTQHLTVTVAHFKMNDESDTVDGAFSREPAMKIQIDIDRSLGVNEKSWEEF
jgi:hypothetical protein